MKEEHNHCDLQNVGYGKQKCPNGNFKTFVPSYKSQATQNTECLHNFKGFCKRSKAQIGEDQNDEIQNVPQTSQVAVVPIEKETESHHLDDEFHAENDDSDKIYPENCFFRR